MASLGISVLGLLGSRQALAMPQRDPSGLTSAQSGLGWPREASTPAMARDAYLTPTPNVSRGPFYPPAPWGLPFLSARPQRWPEPPGTDLTRGTDPAAAPARGQHITLTGRVLRTDGRPVPQARIEIWSVNADALYRAEDDGVSDPGFTGYGITASNADGAYVFRTIRPPSYTRFLGLIKRTAHIHLLVQPPGGTELTTEAWFADEPKNASDSLLSRITDSSLRQRMIMAGESANPASVPLFRFDIVLA